jgi:hypothetical protein
VGEAAELLGDAALVTLGVTTWILLTGEQKKGWVDLAGEPFELK